MKTDIALSMWSGLLGYLGVMVIHSHHALGSLAILGAFVILCVFLVRGDKRGTDG